MFVSDEYNHYGGFSDLLNSHGDAVDPGEPASVAQSLPPHLMIAKSRFVRSIHEEKLNGTRSREDELLEKLKKLTEDSEKRGFDPQKFTELLKEYTEESSNGTNTLVTDKLVQILYNFLQENKDKKNIKLKSPTSTPPAKTKIVREECASAPDILGKEFYVKL